jgi:nanoRNase/pAp phosphatase (c-di-AMP/oligoRNAs hydrolase)
MARPALRASRDEAEQLLGLLEGRPRALLLVHDNPDPDAISGALCLSHLIESRLEATPRIVYGGVIGRAENRNMVKALAVPLWSVGNIKFRPDDAVVMLDTQPSFSNNSLPDGQPVTALIDHHAGGPVEGVALADVRPDYGAVTTILVEYLAGAGVSLPTQLATAVCYAIGTETQDLGRAASRADVAAYMEAFPLSDQPLLGRLRHPTRDVTFFAELDNAIRSTDVLDGVAVCRLGGLRTPDSAAEMADVLASVEDIEWVMCIGTYEDRVVVSVRTRRRDAAAGELLRGVVGERSRAGGHGMMAGGAVELAPEDDPEQVQQVLARRFLEALDRDPDGALRPLLTLPGAPRPAAEEPAEGEGT